MDQKIIYHLIWTSQNSQFSNSQPVLLTHSGRQAGKFQVNSFELSSSYTKLWQNIKSKILVFLLLFTMSSVKAQFVNPFDVSHDKDTITTADLKPPPADKPPVTDAVTIPPIEPKAVPLVDTSIIEFENIFDVDHVPYRTSKPKQTVPIPEETVTTEANEEIPISELKPAVKAPSETKIRKIHNLIFWMLGFTLLILTIVINLKRKTFVNLYRSIFNDNYLNLVQREENQGNSIFFFLLYLSFFLNATIFAYLSVIKFGLQESQKLILSIFFAVIFVYIIRHIIMRTIGAVFPFRKAILQYNFTIIVFNVILGIVLFPLNAFYAFSPLSEYMFYLGLGILLVMYILRQLRGLFLAFRIPNLNLFHFFIYLCTCEIAPFFIIIKVITDYKSAF